MVTPFPVGDLTARIDIEDDHGNTADTASVAPVGEPMPGTIGHPGDVDFFTFDALKDEIYQIEVALGTLLDMQMALLDGEGRRILARNDDFGDSRSPRILWRPSDTGRLYVRVGGAGPHTGSYTLTVSDYEDDHADSAADASPAPIGEPVTGTIEYLKHPEWCDADLFTFDALEGEIYRIDLTPGTLSVAWIDLYDSFSWLAHNTALRLAPDGLRTFWRARDTRALFVGVSGCGAVPGPGQVPRAFRGGDDIMVGGAGTYTLTVSIADIEDDHANSVADASPSPLGEPIPGTIEYEGDEDLFAFNVREGDMYQLDVTPGTLPSTWTAVHAAGGWESQSDWDGPSQPGTSLASLTWRAPRTGTAVVSVGGFYVSDTGTYTLTMSALGIEDDHANYLTGASPATVGEPVYGKLEHGDDVDFFAFEVREGETYQIDVAAPGTPLRLRAELFGERGRRVEVDDDHIVDYDGPFDRTSRVVWRAPSTATISVAVSGIEVWDSGAYTLTVADYADDHGNDLANASHVSVGGSVHGSIHQRGDVDLFTFDAREGETYLVDAAPGTIAILELTLRDQDGERVAFNDEQINYYQPVRIAWQATDSRRLFAEVGGRDGADTGTYALTISAQDDDHGNRPSVASPVRTGGAIAGSIDYVFDVDFFALDVQAGQIYHIDVRPGTLPNPGIRLLDEHGQRLARGDVYGESEARRITWRNPHAARLFLEVGEAGGLHGGGVGTYTLTVSAVDGG